MRKRQFIRRLLLKRDDWEALINRVGFARLSAMPGLCGVWSVKDAIAQIAVHEQYLADRLDEIAHGENYTPAQSPAQLDSFLARFGYPDIGSPLLSETYTDNWAVEKFRGVPMDEVVEQEINAFCDIIRYLEILDSENMLRHKLYARVARHTSERYHEHANAIAQWFMKVKA
jgi:hypothetical protein